MAGTGSHCWIIVGHYQTAGAIVKIHGQTCNLSTE